MTPVDRLIVACDVPSASEAHALASALSPEVRWFKLGLELFSAEGPELVRSFVRDGHSVFLDLKLHDIPATVGRATARLAGLGAELLTIHACGGLRMMEAATRAAAEHALPGRPLRILAVTVLTSLEREELEAVGVAGAVEDVVVMRAKLAAEAGCHGVVASPLEAEVLRRALPKRIEIVTPGVRPAGAAAGDQRRVMTPREATKAGADRIVVGRPIRDAASPRAAAREILKELDV